MDMEVLGKKLDTYRDKRGRIVNVPDELRLEVLSAWEQWKGKASEFYRASGVSYKGMGSMIGKAKRLRREGQNLLPFELRIGRDFLKGRLG